jgi:hypothetical protein
MNWSKEAERMVLALIGQIKVGCDPRILIRIWIKTGKIRGDETTVEQWARAAYELYNLQNKTA